MNTLICCLVVSLALVSGKPFFSSISHYGSPIATPYHVIYAAPYAFQPPAKETVVPKPTVKEAEGEVTIPFAPLTLVKTAGVPTAPFFFQHHAQSKDGSYSYGYYDGPSSKSETGDQFGNVQGVFNYVDSEGKVQTRQYVAGTKGFRVAASDIPLAPVIDDLKGPEPVKETAEVKAAREKFEKIFQKVKSTTRTKRSSGPDLLAAIPYRAPASTSHLSVSANIIPVPITYAVPNVPIATTYVVPKVPVVAHYAEPKVPVATTSSVGKIKLSPETAPVPYSAFIPQPITYGILQPIFNFKPSLQTSVIYHPDGISQFTNEEV